MVFAAFAYVPLVGAYRRFGDYSYGVYIYAFPVQQILAKLLSPLSPMELFAWSAPLTLLLAVLSWRFVESPALAYK